MPLSPSARDERIESPSYEELLASEQRLQQITNAVPALISYVDRDQYYRFNNAAYLDWFGYAPSALEGRHIREILGEAAYQRILPYVERVLSGEVVKYEDEIEYSNVGRRWVSANYIPDIAPDGEVLGFSVLVHDITQRRAVEQRLRASKERLRLITDAMPALISYVGADQRYQFNNAGYREWFGQSPEDVQGAHILEVLGEAAYSTIKHRVEEALSGKLVCFEHLMPFVNREPRWVDVNYIPDIDQDGQVRGFFVMAMDTTERRTAEDALRESEERFRLAAKATDAAIYDIDLIAGTVWWNDTYSRMFGDRPATTDSTWEWWLEHVHPDDRERAGKALKQGINGDSDRIIVEYKFRREDGTYVIVKDRAHVARGTDGTARRILGTMSDVSLNSLTHTTAELAAIFKSNPDVHFRLSSDGTILDFLAGERTHEYGTRDELIGRSIAAVLPVGAQERFLELMRQVSPATTSLTMEYTLDAPRQHSWREARFFHCKQDEVLVVIHDISPRKSTEYALEQHRHHLEQLVSRRTSELETTHRQLRQKERLASVGTLAAGIAHEINNPVGIILLAAQSELDKTRQPNYTKSADALDRIVRNAHRCGKIVKDVLRFARQEPLDMIDGDLNKTLEQALYLVDNTIRTRGVRLHVDKHPEPLEAQINTLEMEQALVNIIMNAITPSTKSNNVYISTAQAPESVSCWVRDDGVGMTAAQLEQVFDPFYTTRQEEGGMGLGLAIAHRIVTEHRGQLTVHSTPGVGTVFTISLPRTEGY